MSGMGVMRIAAEFVMHAIFGAILGAGDGTPRSAAAARDEADRLRRVA